MKHTELYLAFFTGVVAGMVISHKRHNKRVLVAESKVKGVISGIDTEENPQKIKLINKRNQIHKELLEEFKLNPLEYYNLTIHDLSELSEGCYKELSNEFSMEIFPLISRMQSNTKIGDFVPLFLIKRDQSEIIKVTRGSNNTDKLEQYLKSNDQWIYSCKENARTKN